MSYFVGPTLVMNAFTNQLETWRKTIDYNEENFVAFASFLEGLEQAFQYL